MTGLFELRGGLHGHQPAFGWVETANFEEHDGMFVNAQGLLERRNQAPSG